MKRLLCFCLLCVMLVGCTAAAPETTVPETTVGPQLKAGFYVPVNEEYAAALMYIQLAEDGSGLISMMGMPRVLTWAPEGTEYGDMRLSPTAEGLVLEDYISLDFTYTGDSLPEDFLPEPPAPGLYLISSVGFNGDMSFYGAPSRDNGYLELAEDGTGVRDYIHVVDLAKGPVAAVRYADANQGCEIFNLGTGTGYSVLDMVKAFNEANGLDLPYKIVERRPGDIATCYADPAKSANVLGWKAERNLQDMCRDSWNWQSKNPKGFE